MSSLAAVLLVAAGLSQAAPAQDDPRKAAQEAVQKFKAEYAAAAGAEEARAAAVKILAGAPHKATLDMLLKVASSNEADSVRIAAADALGTFHAVEGARRSAASLLTDRFLLKKPEVRKAIIRAAGELRSQEAVPILHQVIEEKPFDVAREAVLALGKIRHKSTVATLIKLLKKIEVTAENGEIPAIPQTPNNPSNPDLPGLDGLEGYATDEERRKEIEERRKLLLEPTNKSLGNITREKWTTSREWDAWWRRHGAGFVVEK